MCLEGGNSSLGGGGHLPPRQDPQMTPLLVTQIVGYIKTYFPFPDLWLRSYTFWMEKEGNGISWKQSFIISSLVSEQIWGLTLLAIILDLDLGFSLKGNFQFKLKHILYIYIHYFCLEIIAYKKKTKSNF